MKKILIIVVFVSVNIVVKAQNYALRVAILGNSITQHGPLPANGWLGNWGMAASSESNDFVHLLERELKISVQNLQVKALSIADFERNYKGYQVNNDGLKSIRDFAPDIILFRIGDNIPDAGIDIPEFHKSFQTMISFLSNGRKPKIIVTNSFWTNPYRDWALQSFAEKNNHRFIDLNGLDVIYENTALSVFKDPFIGRHPSDKGMKAIKDRVWAGMKIDVEDLICDYYGKCNYCQEGKHTGYLDEATCDVIRGWAIDEQRIDRPIQVDILVDGKAFVSLLANETYPDLQKVYGVKGVNHGFKYAVPAGVWWKTDGLKHTITVRPCWEGAKFLNWSGKEVKCTKTDEIKAPEYASDWVNTECNEIIGWVYDKNNLTNTIKVDFVLNDKVLATLEANQQRPELLEQVSTTPDAVKHVFVVKLPSLVTGSYNAQIRLAGTTKIIGNINNFQCPKMVLATEQEDFEITVFPNPNQGGFRLKLPTTYQNHAISIFDSLGRIVEISQENDEIVLKNATNGLYFLKTNISGKSIVKRFVVR